MNPLQIKNTPLKEYLEIIKTTFNSNNYVFEVSSIIQKEGHITDKFRYVSESGFNQHQNERKGMLVFNDFSTRWTVGLDEFLNTVQKSYMIESANFVRTVFYDSLSSIDKVIIEYIGNGE